MLTVAATPDLVPFLLERMAPEERHRLEAVTGGQGEARLRQNVQASDLTWAGVDAAGVVNMGGVFPLEPCETQGVCAGTGYVWQVITPAIALHKRAYVRQGRAMLVAALAQYERLTTLVAADYLAALRHIVRLGFDVAPPELVGGDRACRCALAAKRLRRLRGHADVRRACERGF